MIEQRLQPVILCGGSGTRLWPLSRGAHPKQFLSLVNETSLLQDTVSRLGGGNDGKLDVSAPILVCNVDHRFLVASQLQQLGIIDSTILLEPHGRGTAPALTMAALLCDAKNYDPVLVAAPADHVISDSVAFQAAIKVASTRALRGAVVVLGIPATSPETGYGYIRVGANREQGVYQVSEFVEKPDFASASNFVASGKYRWNSGIFVLKASVWLKAIKNFRPDILESCQAAIRASVSDMDFVRPEPEQFHRCPSESIDYAVIEHLPGTPDLGIDIDVVELDAGWSDVGVWDALWRAHSKDEAGNARLGETLLQDCEDSLMLSSSRLVAGVGLRNMAVVETPDAVLVVDLNKTQDVKLLTGQLTSEYSSLLFTHRKVHRPWGSYDIVDQGDRFKVKRLVVRPGARLSLQKHSQRAEHWIVVRGMAEVIKGTQRFILRENESAYISVGDIHRLGNPGSEPLEVIEVQTGDYLEEDDIERLDSDY